MAKKQDRYLHKRGNTYYFRKKHNGKTFKRSLNTTDKQTARDLRNFYLGNKPLIYLVAGAGFEPTTFGL
jgi:hypothetical protein